jgi:hypothetical protein
MTLAVRVRPKRLTLRADFAFGCKIWVKRNVSIKNTGTTHKALVPVLKKTVVLLLYQLLQ